MIIALTGIRVAPHTAEALKVPVVLQRRITVLWILMMMAMLPGVDDAMEDEDW